MRNHATCTQCQISSLYTHQDEIFLSPFHDRSRRSTRLCGEESGRTGCGTSTTSRTPSSSSTRPSTSSSTHFCELLFFRDSKLSILINLPGLRALYRVFLPLAYLGCVDFDIGIPTVCPALLKQVIFRQNCLSNWARGGNIWNLSQPDPGPRAHGTP